VNAGDGDGHKSGRVVEANRDRVAAYSAQERFDRLQFLGNLTVRTMSPDQRLEYQALNETKPIISIVPEGQLVVEKNDERENDTRRPYIGLAVRYHARPAEGRSGKTVFPALVTKVDGGPSEVLELAVTMSTDEGKDVRCPRRSKGNPYHSWSFVDGDVLDQVTMLGSQIAVLAEAVGGLQNEIAELKGNGSPRPPRPK
jgi:hypothetical protein